MAFEIAQAGSRHRRLPSALSTFPRARNLLPWANPFTLLRTVTGLPFFTEAAVRCNPLWRRADLTVGVNSKNVD
jgi:hypothetical protein